MSLDVVMLHFVYYSNSCDSYCCTKSHIGTVKPCTKPCTVFCYSVSNLDIDFSFNSSTIFA